MPSIFLSTSEQRQTASAHALADAIVERFGDDALGTGLGVRGEDARPGSPRNADVVVVLIDAQWPTSAETMQDDAVFDEIRAALEHERLLITVLEHDAHMPDADAWPPSLARLVNQPSVRLNGSGFDTVLDLLQGELARGREGDSAPHIDAGESEEPSAFPTVAGEVRQHPPNHLIVTGALLVGLVVLAGFLLTSRFWLAPPPDVIGEWVAEVDYGRGVVHDERFNLRLSGSDLTGHASYHGSRRVIEAGEVDDGTIRFVTRSRQYIGNTQHALTHAYEGRLAGEGELNVTLQTSGGLTVAETVEFVARRP